MFVHTDAIVCELDHEVISARRWVGEAAHGRDERPAPR
jgi:hypothetical protein